MEKLYRLRVRFARLGLARELSHLEQIKALRKIAQSSGLACALSKSGKLKAVKMSFGPAIPLGYESLAEYADIFLTAPVSHGEALDKLNKAAEGGFSAVGARSIPLHFPSVESLVNAAEYEVRGNFGSAPAPLEKFLGDAEIMIKKIKPGGIEEIINARPLIVSVRLVSPDCVELKMRFRPKSNLKPEKIIGAWLNISDEQAAGEFKFLRKELYWENKEGKFIAP
ncbi:MAG: TIGR03936 family radical SAM-associated protein [Elusimicrobia bacterium]|nr:TIGR03936 family radical SAM-associated protein [Elusimicrobiota bacterium]